MASAPSQYTTEIGRELRFNATWSPGMPVSLGDIGTFDDDHVFSRITSLDNFGISLKVDAPSGDAKESFHYASAGALDVGFKAAGQPAGLVPSVPITEAGLGIKFKREHAVVFRADDVEHTRFNDEVELRQSVLRLIQAGLWDRDWSVVTHVGRARSTTVLVAKSSGASVEFVVSGGISAGGLELLSLEGQVRTYASSEMQLTIVGSGNLTPLFRAKQIRRRFLRLGREELRATYSAEVEELDPSEPDEDIFENTPVYDHVTVDDLEGPSGT